MRIVREKQCIVDMYLEIYKDYFHECELFNLPGVIKPV